MFEGDTATNPQLRVWWIQVNSFCAYIPMIEAAIDEFYYFALEYHPPSLCKFPAGGEVLGLLEKGLGCTLAG
jgi:hypothetical protein